MLIQLYNRLLVDLPADPSRYLGESAVPLDSSEFAFVLADHHHASEGAAPTRYLFYFAVEPYRDQEQLHIVGARMIPNV